MEQSAIQVAGYRYVALKFVREMAIILAVVINY
jgi:hypothetical protein